MSGSENILAVVISRSVGLLDNESDGTITFNLCGPVFTFVLLRVVSASNRFGDGSNADDGCIGMVVARMHKEDIAARALVQTVLIFDDLNFVVILLSFAPGFDFKEWKCLAKQY